MAFLRSIESQCSEPGCTKRAIVQLIDRWNGERGKYCKRHGERACLRQTQSEFGNDGKVR
jgi:hypothetical protein